MRATDSRGTQLQSRTARRVALSALTPPPPQTKTPKGFILTKDITDCRAAEGKVGKKSGKGEFAFEVITKLRTYYFAPTTSELRDEWIAVSCAARRRRRARVLTL